MTLESHNLLDPLPMQRCDCLPKRTCTHMYMQVLLMLPAAERTFSHSPGNEKVRNTIEAEAAMFAPSPESFNVILSGMGPCDVANYIHV